MLFLITLYKLFNDLLVDGMVSRVILNPTPKPAPPLSCEFIFVINA